MTDAPILAIIGMHRSGTSLVAQWLQACGLNLGADFIPADFSNPRGHIEDARIVALHEALLAANGTDFLLRGISAGHLPLAMPSDFQDSVRAILHQRDVTASWGWKDPRTTLFLEGWRAYLPTLHVLMVYRSCHQVVRSLLQRHYPQRDESFPKRWGTALAAMRHYASAWNLYNQALLSDQATYPAQTLLLSVPALQHMDMAVLAYLKVHWGFSLRSIPFREVYEPALFSRSARPDIHWTSKLMCAPYARTFNRLALAEQQSLEQVQELFASLPLSR